MNKSLFLSLLLSIFCVSIFCQNNNDSIVEVKTRNGIQFKQSGEILRLKDIEFIVAKNEVALNYLKTAKSYYTIAGILSGCAGFMIGFPIGYLVPSGYFNVSMFAVGCGLGIIAIPVTIAFKNKLRLSIDAYNNQLKPVANSVSLNLKIGYSSNGLGIRVLF